MVSETSMSTKEANETLEKLVRKYDGEDEYYLALNDGHGTLISLIQLKDNKFGEWADAIEMALKSKNKLHFLDRSIAQPNEDDVKYMRWKKINILVGLWISITIELTLRALITKTRIMKIM